MFWQALWLILLSTHSQDLHERCEELMSMKSPLDHSKILEPEESGSASIGMSFWGMVGGNPSSTCTKGNDDPGKTEKESITNLSKSRVVTFGSLHGAVSLIIVILSILIALIMSATVWRTRNEWEVLKFEISHSWNFPFSFHSVVCFGGYQLISFRWNTKMWKRVRFILGWSIYSNFWLGIWVGNPIYRKPNISVIKNKILGFKLFGDEV